MDSRQKHAGMTDSIHPVNGSQWWYIFGYFSITYEILRFAQNDRTLTF